VPVAEVGDTFLHYEVAGTGEPMLWITGFAISSVIFEPVLPAYTSRFTCISYDNRGAARSPRWTAPVSIPQLAADAAALLDHLDVDSAHVHGLSMGGMVAQEMAIRFPDRVRGLVLGGSSPGGPRGGLRLAELRLLVREVLAGRHADVRAKVAEGVLFSPRFRREHPEVVDATLRGIARHRSDAAGILSHLAAGLYHETWSRLPRIAAPTLVVHGGADSLVPLRSAELLAARIPDAELAVVPGVGHGYLLEDPETSRALVLDWFDRRSPITPGPQPSTLDVVTEPVTRALGLPLGLWRTGVGTARLVAEEGTRRVGRVLRQGVG